MNNSHPKIVIIFSIAVIVFLGLLAVLFLSHRQPSTNTTSDSTGAKTISPVLLDTAAWQTYTSNSSMDSSSFYQRYPDLPKTTFSFKYPDGWEISKNTVFTNWHSDTPFSMGILHLSKSNLAAINYQVGTRSDFDARLWRDVFYPQKQQSSTVNGVSVTQYFRSATSPIPEAVVYRISSDLSLLVTTSITCDVNSDKTCQSAINEINGLLISFSFQSGQ